MRDWTGIDTASVPPATAPDFQPRVRRMLGDIDYFLRDLSRGMGRIQQGQVPDGSGNTIGNNGTLTQYWFKPGISDPFIAYMGTGSGQGGNISSTSHDTKGFIKLGYPTAVAYVDEANKFVGVNVAAPAAALHLQPGVSGTTTLIPTSSVVHNWDAQNRTGSGGTNAGAFTIASLKFKTSDYTLYNGVGTLGTNPETVGMGDGSTVQNITPGKVWTCTITVACLGATVDNSGDVEFHIVDSTGAKYSATGLTGLLNGLGTAFVDYTFTINGAGTSTGSGTANTVIIGLNGKTGLTQQYIACDYFQITTGGASDNARWNLDSGTLSGKITKDGYVGIGTGSDTLGAMLTAKIDTATNIGAIIKGAASQSGDLSEWQDSAGTVLSKIKSDGTFDGPISTTSAITVTDNAFTIQDNVDTTKKLQFQVSGVSTATTRTLTVPNQNGTLPTVDNAATITGPWTFDTNNDGTKDLIVLSTAAGHTGPGTGGFYIKDASTGFAGELAPTTAGLTGDRLYSLPDGSGEILIHAATQNVSNKTMQASNILQASTASSGCGFADITVNTKRLRMVLSTAVGNNDFKIATTAAREYTFTNVAGNVLTDGNVVVDSSGNVVTNNGSVVISA